MSELNIYQNRIHPTEPMLNVSVEWVTQISENRSGKENRMVKITEPQYSIEGSDFVLRDEDFEVFAQAFIDAEGKNNAFPFKCPLDYYCTAGGEFYDNNSFQRGILVPIDALNYQIVKQYYVGGVSTYKTITLPVDGTIHVYESGVEVFPIVNLSTGGVTFLSEPSGVLTVSCEFRLPMRFDVDDNQLNQIKRAVNSIYTANDTSIYLAVNFRLVEDMNYERKSLLSSGNWTGNLTYNFDGHPLSDIAYSDRSLTRIQSSDNKREIRDGLGVFRKKYSIANNNMNWLATQRYFNLFMACKGRLLPFTFEGQTVRLDSDVFTASMIGYNNVNLDSVPRPACRISGAYTATLSVPFTSVNNPRETSVASFDLSDYNGETLPVSNFVLDDVVFVVPSNFNVSGCYSLVNNVRILNLPSNALILYDGDNPNYADGGLNHPLQTNYVFNGQTYIVPAAPDGVPVTPLSTAILGFFAMGILGQPHNGIGLSALAARGYINNSIVSFKLMHICHGGGEVTLIINVPQC